jgi:hypothetical protein
VRSTPVRANRGKQLRDNQVVVYLLVLKLPVMNTIGKA